MNQLETNLTLWAICSILLFEILIIICLCRCCFNRIQPKRFYIKRDEYEYLPEISGGTLSKYQGTILRPPRADELAHIGTIRAQNGLENLGFYQDDRTSPDQQWLESQSPMIYTTQLPPSDYEIYPHSTDDYSYRQPPPRPIFIDFRSYRSEDDEIENYRLDSFPPPPIHRVDTSTEYYGMRYSNAVPKSILKSGLNATPPIDYFQIDRTEPVYPETSTAEIRRVPIETIVTPTTSKYRMKFAYIHQLHDVNWEVPGELRSTFQSNNEPMANSSQRPINRSQPYHSWPVDLTEQQAFEY